MTQGDSASDPLRADLARAERRIAELEAEVQGMASLRTILENAPAYVAHLTPEGDYLYLNKFAPGFSQADITGNSSFEFTDPKDHGALRACLETVRRTKAPSSFSIVGPGAHGSPTRYFQMFAPVLEGGEVASLVVVASEVSPLVETIAALEQSEAKLRVAVAASRMGLWSFDPDNEENREVDARASVILGVGPDSTSAERLSRVPPDDRARVRDALADALRTDGSYGPLEFRVAQADGQLRWIEGTGSVVRGSDGRRRVVGGVVDITERKRLEEQAAHALKMESIGRLAGGIAHDFNNMLTAILSHAELAAADLPPGDARESLTEIQNAAHRSAELTARLLAFARKQPVLACLVDPNALIVDVSGLLRRLLGAQVELVTALGATRPIMVDSGQFEQLLVNLATNARDAMRDGGRLTIETSDATLGAAEPELAAVGPPGSNLVRLRVSDDGQGIPAEQLSHLFEPFFTTKEVGQGTGLGLAMVYGVVTRHGGHIAVHSTPGGGTTFVITLLAAETASAHATGARRAEEPHEEPPTYAQLLVVEDEPQVRKILVRALRSAQYQVVEAADGLEALEVAATLTTPIALVVTDMVMPRMGGRQMVQTLRATRPDLPVIYVSGYAEDSTDGLRDAPFSDVLGKPFLPKALVEKVRALLARVPSR
jgi:two-component system, cell cycle sensor histidine kinase and response regulator CckA